LGDRLPMAADVERLPLTRGVFAEALRLYPPAWILFRRALEAQDLAGYPIPANSHLCLSPYVMGRDARFYPEPERFDPARWLGESERPRGSFFPFGLGNRRCI